MNQDETFTRIVAIDYLRRLKTHGGELILKQILFVCSGNTCRSPMAEAILNDMVNEHPQIQVEAQSAGTFACEGAEMSGTAVEALKNLGIRLDHKHRAQSFTARLANSADLILTMQEQHMEEILAMIPEAEPYTHTLKGYAVGVDGFTGTNKYDISDPFRSPLDVYIECAQELKESITDVLQRLEKEAKTDQEDSAK